MTNLFRPVSYGRLTAPNRIVRSATHEGMADDVGNVTPKLLDIMDGLGAGGTGTVISGHAFVLPEGRASRFQLGIYQDDQVAGIREMARAVQRHGARFILQLAHAGARSDAATSGFPAKGPSAAASGVEHAGEMNGAEIRRTIDGFVAAALRARSAGCDGVQVHAAHGYLLSSFVSPLFNTREDLWGGSTENRARILLEIISGIRNVAPDLPVFVKMNASDFVAGGLETEEMIAIGALLQEAGVDAVEMSGGTPASGKKNPIRAKDDSVWYEAAAAQWKETLDLPLILVGGIRDLATAKRLLDDQVTDGVALSRPLLREPDLPGRWKKGEAKAATCVSCNRCLLALRKGEAVQCLYKR